MIYMRKAALPIFFIREAAVPMIFIREVALPMSIRGFIMPDVDGNYNIYINDKLSEERRQITIEHELQHLKNRDCYCDLPVKVIESNIMNG
ncbi:ImmA/IrrE family metallo-endopeptidase [Clostridium aminobutyricum]|uniref:IrrE N-terminal-like domain-containing protein n=1 Tax=Clostridium aminobutyricum TaxID=33953 RepID=A0A939IJD5_CLOAM|nr:ImmA/IrrE family metallo-endopeptidase [Clostridium aminobutyricum]MBN7773459.1 hypothetical protein [Clostridium aminobutyricum]